MSLNVNPIEPVRILDPRCNINNKRFYAVLEGGATVTYKNFSTTSYSNNSIQFSCPPPNPNILVDRRVFLECGAAFTFSGTASSGNLLVAEYDAPRAFPLSSNISTMQVTMNNANINLNMADVLPHLMRFNAGHKYLSNQMSGTPSMLDASQEYDALIGAVRNPLGLYTNSINGCQVPRGAFPLTINTNGASSATVSAKFYENIFVSPFNWAENNHSAFIGLQTMDFNITMNQDLSRMWSHATNPNVSNFAVSVTLQDPKAHFTYITPKIDIPIGNLYSYPYYTVNRYFTQMNASVSAGSSSQITSNNQIFASIPRKIYILIRRPNSDQTVNTTDTYCRIDSISITFDNNTGLLSTCDSFDLFNISRSNGLQLSYPEWHGNLNKNLNTAQKYGGVGSILCLMPGKDIGLPVDLSPGVKGQFTFSCVVNFTNLSASSITPTLEIIEVSEGVMNIVNNSIVQNVAVLSRMDVLDAKKQPGLDWNEVNFVEGGDFFGSIKDFLVNKLVPGFKKAVEIGKDVLPYVKDVVGLVRGVAGVGDERLKQRRAGVLVGGCNDSDSDEEKEEKKGGRILSRKQLKKRLY